MINLYFSPGDNGFMQSSASLSAIPWHRLNFFSVKRVYPILVAPALNVSHALLLPFGESPFLLFGCACVPQAILQALELLLVRKYIPRRSFLIALGHDEEVQPLHPIPNSETPTGWSGGVSGSSP